MTVQHATWISSNVIHSFVSKNHGFVTALETVRTSLMNKTAVSNTSAYFALLKPNSITLAGSELVRSWFEAGSKLVRTIQRNGIWLRTCLRTASNQLRISQRNGIWRLLFTRFMYGGTFMLTYFRKCRLLYVVATSILNCCLETAPTNCVIWWEVCNGRKLSAK